MLSWRLAGLVALADWIGSNQRHFHYTQPEATVADYWRNVAQPAARRAIADSGVRPAAPSKTISTYAVVPPEFHTALTDAQEWALDIVASALRSVCH